LRQFTKDHCTIALNVIAVVTQATIDRRAMDSEGVLGHANRNRRFESQKGPFNPIPIRPVTCAQP
jgi:hypothetical protein